MKTWTLLAAGGLAAAATGAVILWPSNEPVTASATAAATSGSVTSGATSGAKTSTGSPNANASDKQNEKLTFEVAANMGGLVPGAQLSLPVQVKNPPSNKKVTLTVVTLDIAVGDANADCDRSNLSVGRYDVNVPGTEVYELKPGQTKSIPVSIQMIDSATLNQEPCRGATFPLTINGSAVGTK